MVSVEWWLIDASTRTRWDASCRSGYFGPGRVCLEIIGEIIGLRVNMQ